MCPLYPVHLVLMYGTLVVCMWLAGVGSAVNAVSQVSLLKVRLQFNDTPIDVLDVREGQKKMITFYLDDLPLQAAGEIMIEDENHDKLNHIAIEPINVSLASMSKKQESNTLNGNFNISGKFLGFTKVKFVLSDGDDKELMVSKPFKVTVQRGEHIEGKIFIFIVIILLTLAYINMGCAIDLEVIKKTLRYPLAPAIGLVSQYIFMPLVSYFIGYLIFYDVPSMWLGLFMTGCSPGGGGSNVWTYLLGGSLDLSVTMTFISTVGAFAAVPIWVYCLARTIFHDGDFSGLPYEKIFYLVIALALPLSIGILIKWRSQRVSLVLKRLLKPLSLLFIIFVMTYGIYANLFIFSYFDWRVAVAGILLPWLGFVFGAVLSRLFNRSLEEITAISIETGIQNTGISIAILQVVLSEYAPLGDIAMVVPVAVATMTPVPLLIIYIVKKIFACRRKGTKVEVPINNSDRLGLSSSTTPIQSTSDNYRSLIA